MRQERKQREIGEIFELDGVKLVCLPCHPDEYKCEECALLNLEECYQTACLPYERGDKKRAFFRHLLELGDNYHYSQRLDKVLRFKESAPSDRNVCKKCALGERKTTWTDCCEGALCISIMRKDRRDGYFVDLEKSETNKTQKQ